MGDSRLSFVLLSSSERQWRLSDEEDERGCQGPVKANRMPGFWIPAKSTWPSEKVGPVNSERPHLRGTPLLDDPARLLILMLYQRQVCSMNVLGELKVTATTPGPPTALRHRR